MRYLKSKSTVKAMEALLLDRLGYKAHCLKLGPGIPPQILVWSGRGFRRRREREHAGKPHVKVYVEELTLIRADTPISGYNLRELDLDPDDPMQADLERDLEETQILPPIVPED